MSESTVSAPPPASPSLWRHRGFVRFWTGETASQFGEQIGNLAIPVLAIQLLGASSFVIGLLNAAETAAFLVIGLPAGAWIDRMLKRRVMLTADLVRALALGLIPILWLTHVLAIWQIIVIATIVGAASVFFDVSYQSYIPVLVPRDRISDANSKLETTSQIARIAGPAISGGLLAIVQAPVILAVTAVTYLTSFTALATLKDTEIAPPREDRRPLRVEIAEGLRFVFGQKLLLRIVLCTSVGNLFGSIGMTMIPVLVLRNLHISTAFYGIGISLGAIGGVLGAILTPRIGRLIGEGTAIPVSAVLFGVSLCFFPLMGVFPGAAIPLLVVGEFIVSVTVLVYNITQVSFRQRICPPALLGRMNASIRFLVWGVMPIGGILSGVLATGIGVLPTIWIGSIGTLLAAGFVVFSPLVGMRKLPDAVEGAAAGGPAAGAPAESALPES